MVEVSNAWISCFVVLGGFPKEGRVLGEGEAGWLVGGLVGKGDLSLAENLATLKSLSLLPTPFQLLCSFPSLAAP